jgi:uncharacterized protein YbjT (DUF2867 family)
LKRTIALTGATGYIGGRLAPRLLDAGYRVRAFVRSPRKLEGRAWASNPNLEICPTPLDSPEPLARDLAGCEAAFYLVHSMNAAGEAYAERDRSLAMTFAPAARAAGVKRIVYLGGLGETGPDLSEHLRSRREVEAALASGGVPVTVLRAAMIIGSGSASFEILRYLVERLPVMITPRWVHTQCQPIAIRNVIEALQGVLEAPETAGETYDIGGPEILSYRDIMRVMAEELKLPKRLVVPVPVLTPRLSSYWIHLVTPIGHAIARPLAEGLRNPVVCREHRIRGIVKTEWLDVRESIRLALRKVASRDVETTWSMAGPIPGDPDWAGGKVFRDLRSTPIAAPPDAVYRAVCRVGGGNGWYAADWLWRIRGWMDRLVGGPGLRRGRRNPETVGYGEALDFWRVTGVEANRRLSLRAEMKLPGEALLEFRIQGGSAGATLEQEAIFSPRGLLGLAYWYAVLPFHHFVFEGMLDGIRREAEKSQLMPLADGQSSSA